MGQLGRITSRLSASKSARKTLSGYGSVREPQSQCLLDEHTFTRWPIGARYPHGRASQVYTSRRASSPRVPAGPQPIGRIMLVPLHKKAHTRCGGAILADTVGIVPLRRAADIHRFWGCLPGRSRRHWIRLPIVPPIL